MRPLINKLGGLSFRNRLLALLLVVSLVQAGAAAITFRQMQTAPIQQKYQAQLDASLRGAMPVFDQAMQNSTQQLGTLASDDALGKAIGTSNYAAAAQILATSSQKFGSASTAGSSPSAGAGASAAAAFFTDPSGNVVAGTRPSAPVIDVDGATSLPLHVGAKFLGTLHVPVVINKSLLTKAHGYGGGDDVGLYIVVDGKTINSSANVVSSSAAITHGVQTVALAGADKLVMANPLRSAPNVLLAAALPKSVVTAALASAHRELWIFIGAMCALMVFVSILVSLSVSVALQRFASITRRLARGELNQRIPVHGTDEVAVLASSFNDMAHNLEQRIESLTDARLRLRRQVELFGEALANAHAVDEMLTAVCTIAIESTSATHARFWALSEDGELRHAACVGLRPHDTSPSELEREVLRHGRAVRVDGDSSWLVVPARTGEQTMVGFLTIASTTHALQDDEVRLAERLAVQAAVALENAQLHAKLFDQATRDGLTGLANHRTMQEQLERDLDAAEDAGMPLGVALLDVDNFKKINDTHGHQIGDDALRAISAALTRVCSSGGFCARYGGEEFVAIMPGCDSSASWRIADRIREEVSMVEIPLADGGILKLTCSIGVSNLDQVPSRLDNARMLNHADMALYRAKHGGKNRVELWTPELAVMPDTSAMDAPSEDRDLQGPPPAPILGDIIDTRAA